MYWPGKQRTWCGYGSQIVALSTPPLKVRSTSRSSEGTATAPDSLGPDTLCAPTHLPEPYTTGGYHQEANQQSKRINRVRHYLEQDLLRRVDRVNPDVN